MIKLLLLFMLTISLSAKNITPNDVFTLSTLIQEHVHFLLKHYKVKHEHDKILRENKIVFSNLQPRNTWQKSYEILVKINMLREMHYLPSIEPVGIAAIEKLNPDMVYEMNQRILTELKIFEVRQDIKIPKFKLKVFMNKSPIDNYNKYIDISVALDELNQRALTPNYVYAETMRIYDDISIVLHHLGVNDTTTPDEKIKEATPKDAIKTAMELLKELQRIQVLAGIQRIDFSEFDKDDATPSDVYTMTGLIISELQPIKASIGLTKSVTPPAVTHTRKKPENVEQLMRWNLKRLALISVLHRRAK